MEDRSQKAISLFNRKADAYAERFQNLEKYHDGFDVVCDKIEKGANILDLACGPGNISNYLLSKRSDLKILGIDLAPAMIKIAKANNPSARFKVLDIRDVKSLDQRFDAIIIGFGMPYLSKLEVETLIVDCSKLLSKNGLIYLSTMEGKYESSGYQKSSDGKDELFIYYHESEYLRTFLNHTGFKILWEKQQPFMEDGKVRFEDYIVVAQKGDYLLTNSK